MSLSSETQRVQQGVKDTLKTLIQKLGGTVGSERVDGYAALANAISNKLLPNNLLSAETAALYGKPGTATPNDVFADIFTRLGGKGAIQTGSYVGTGGATLDLDLPVAPKTLILAGDYQAPLVISEVGEYHCIYDNTVGNGVTVNSFGNRVSLTGENDYSAYNHSGSKYFWTALY